MLTALLVQTERTMQEETNLLESRLLDQEVINLHNIARTLEEAFGQKGQLSEEIRHCADKLHQLLKRY